ncbi:MAG: DUF1003 domain-containing protein [Nanoarchaeota archaeon]|nr:DUF1003 domain-containing protein [Nanoarchaeota archaeon]
MKNKEEASKKKSVPMEQYTTIRVPKTVGQRAADLITKWAGSWTFILTFFIFLSIWIGTNGLFILKYLHGELTDPYPFILLNLALSCLAAIQAPIILMSQNRENQRNRLRAQYDYSINKKAEKEIRELKSQLTRIENHISRRRK